MLICFIAAIMIQRGEMSQPVPEKPFYHRITKNAFYLLVGNGMTNVAAFGSNVILGRILGLNGYATMAKSVSPNSVMELAMVLFSG